LVTEVDALTGHTLKQSGIGSYPHGCGEHTSIRSNPIPNTGSSPRVVGLDAYGQADRQADDVGFKSFRSANVTIEGIELIHMIKKSQMVCDCGEGLSAAEQLYSLAD